MPKLTMTEDEILAYLDGAITKWRLINLTKKSPAFRQG